MITGLSSKLAIGTLGLGTTGVIGYGVYKLVLPKTISDILLSSEYKPLNVDEDSDDSKWTILVSKHLNSSQTSPAKITDLTLLNGGEQKDQNNKDLLKNKCKSLLSKNYVSDKDLDYKNALEWCTTKNATEN